MAINNNFSPIPHINIQDITNIEKEITCSVSYEYLDQAVILSPCTHRVQQAVAERLYGTFQQVARQRNKGCPICYRKVTNYKTDYMTRNLCQKLPDLLDGLKNVIDLERQRVAEIKSSSYPGEAGRFKVSYHLNNDLISKQEVVLEEEGGGFSPLVSRAVIYKYPNQQKLQLFIVFRYLEFQDYLIESGFAKNAVDNIYQTPGRSYYLSLEDNSQVRKMVNLLLENNQFYLEDSLKIKAFVS